MKDNDFNVVPYNSNLSSSARFLKSLLHFDIMLVDYDKPTLFRIFGTFHCLGFLSFSCTAQKV